MQTTVLALDIGSTRLKAALFDGQGRIVSSVQQASPLAGATVVPEAVLRAAGAAAAQVCEGLRPDAIAITGATRTSVLADARGHALGDAIKLDDGRGAHYQEEMRRAYRREDATGLGAFHALARALDVRDQEPDRHARARWIMELKDWLNLRLTGVACCDAVVHARIAPADQDMEALLARLGLEPGFCPDPVEAGRVIGHVGDGLGAAWAPLRGVPVVQCGFDAWCASYGMGCVEAGAAYNVCGTTEVFGAFDAQPRAIAGVPCLPWGSGLHHLGGPCLTGLGTLAWFGERFLGDPDPAAVLGCAAQAGSDVPLCVPFVTGERMPFWRTDLRASFIGVQAQHGRPEFARALLDGLLVFQRCLLRLLAPAASRVHLSGGGASLPQWAQGKAGAFGVPVHVADCAEPGLLGACLCALVGLERFTDLGQAQRALASAGRALLPLPSEAARLDALEPRLLAHFPPLPHR